VKRLMCLINGHAFGVAMHRYTIWGRRWVQTCPRCGKERYVGHG
jgi:hypothetical protein